MKQWYIEFRYDENGKGLLKLHNDSLLPIEIPSRTGSIKKNVGLINEIQPGIWSIHDEPELTTENGMIWDVDNLGWKVRLWTPAGEKSHYLIHPDGNGKGWGRRGNGTAGCIGLQGDGLLLKDKIHFILIKQLTIQVYVNSPIPEGE